MNPLIKAKVSSIPNRFSCKSGSLAMARQLRCAASLRPARIGLAKP